MTDLRPAEDLAVTPDSIAERERKLVEIRGSVEIVDPEHSEDAILYLPDKGLFAVFDGIGGTAHGEVASRMAQEYLNQAAERLDSLTDPTVVAEELGKILEEVDTKMLEAGQTNPDLKKMGTTAAV